MIEYTREKITFSNDEGDAIYWLVKDESNSLAHTLRIDDSGDDRRVVDLSSHHAVPGGRACKFMDCEPCNCVQYSYQGWAWARHRDIPDEVIWNALERDLRTAVGNIEALA